MELTEDQRNTLQALRDQLLEALELAPQFKRCLVQAVGGLEDGLKLKRTFPPKEERRREHYDPSLPHRHSDSYKIEHYLKRK